MEHTAHGYWLAEAGEPSPAPPLQAEVTADVLVLGGGYTGLWSAWYAKQLEPAARVVLLESELCGQGPSGRNGGFCHAMWWSLGAMRDRWGAEPALAVAEAAEAAVGRIGGFCSEQRVDAWFRRADYLHVSTAPAHDRLSRDAVATCRELGVPERAVELSAAEVAARCASPAFRGGAACPGAASVQPARLALGLRERVRAAGVEVYERSPVRALREGGDGVRAETVAGAVLAPRAVLAVGAAAKGRRGPLRGRLSIVSSHLVLTEPVPELLEEIGWTGGECITDSRALLHYFRTTPDGRIAFGWGGGRVIPGARTRGRAELDPEVVATVRAHLLEYFPGLAGRRITHAWGGLIDASPLHLPMVLSQRHGRVFAAAGYTGNGVGPSNMVGRALAALALDRRDPETRLAFVDAKVPPVPPEPFHWLGGEAIRRGILAKEQAELAGRDPGRLATAVAAIPELIGFHIGR